MTGVPRITGKKSKMIFGDLKISNIKFTSRVGFFVNDF